jgi:hypothetical protein
VIWDVVDVQTTKSFLVLVALEVVLGLICELLLGMYIKIVKRLFLLLGFVSLAVDQIRLKMQERV